LILKLNFKFFFKNIFLYIFKIKNTTILLNKLLQIGLNLMSSFEKKRKEKINQTSPQICTEEKKKERKK